MYPEEVVSELRNGFQSGKTRPVEFRIKQIRNLKRMYLENQERIVQALSADLHKCRHEAIVMELLILINDLDNILANIKKWIQPEIPEKSIVNILDDLCILKEPYGVVLVIGAWNYPFQLLLLPVAGAIAAGNCVLMKPSEIAANSAKLIAELIPRYLDSDCYQVFTGGVAETTELLKEKFDYIFYTGSSRVGQIIQEAAAKNLTPTTLELGGKSPVYLDDSVDMKRAVKRILWGKFANAGQTCVAPDYLLCTKSVEKKFVEISKDILEEWYGSDARMSPDYGRIINDLNMLRIHGYLKCGTVAIGGGMDITQRYFGPTILVDVAPSNSIMKEEIFGPILPIITVQNVYDAISFINEHEKPLAMYIFSNKKSDVDLMIANTSCGGITVNDTIMHLCVDTLPFGGVGNSGFGQYHGKYTFDTFTHKKACLRKNLGVIAEKLGQARYPPYNEGKTRFLNMLLKRRGPISFGFIRYLIAFGLGAACVFMHYNGLLQL